MRVARIIAVSLLSISPLGFASPGQAEQGYPRIRLTDTRMDTPPEFRRFAKSVETALAAHDAEKLAALAAPGFECVNWDEQDCTSGNVVADLMGDYGSWSSMQAIWGNIRVNAGLEQGELCAPQDLEWDGDAAETARRRVSGSEELVLTWLAALDHVRVYGSPDAVREIDILSDELVFPTFYLGSGDPDAADHKVLETHFDFMARQQVLLADGRRGFVYADDLSPLIADRMCFSKTEGQWRISRLYRAYFP